MIKIIKGFNLISLAITLVFGFTGSLYADDLAAFKDHAGTIRISGGTAHIPVMKEVAKQIMTANPKIEITIAGGGSGVGIEQVGQGLVDIGNSGRKPTDEEIEKYQLHLFKWALDGVGIVVNPKNTVTSLSKQQLKDIFSGKVSNWKELGGMEKSITVYTRDNASGTREVFFEKALDKGEITSKANFVASNGAMKTAIAGDPFGIGYVSVGHMDESVAPVAIDGVTPSIETVKNGSYKISRGLYSNTKGAPTPLVNEFITYLYSESGEKIISANGFIAEKR
jgi:phosphate transport system substrate-binding protein